MHRLLIGTCALALLVVASVRAEDDKNKEKKTGADALFKELVTKYRAEKDKDEKKKLLTSYAEKFIDYAIKNPKADDAPKALANVLQIPLPGGKNGLKAKAVATLMKDFTKAPAITAVVKSFRIQPDDPDGYAFIKGVFEQHPDTLTRALAAKSNDLTRAAHRYRQAARRRGDPRATRESPRQGVYQGRP